MWLFSEKTISYVKVKLDFIIFGVKKKSIWNFRNLAHQKLGTYLTKSLVYN